jgi:hypothetical protein
LRVAVSTVATWLIAAAAAGASTPPKPSIALSKQPPSVIRIGESVVIRGRARHVPAGSPAVLQGQQRTTWTRLAGGTVGRQGVVTVRWTVAKGTAIGPISLRLALRRGGHVVAASAPASSAIGSAYVPCAPPTPPSHVPSGDGWITGGVYGEGGPFPGIDACVSEPYTIEARDSGGSVAARETVPGGDSYTLVVPAGSYMLESAGCRGRATVSAGQQTRANTFCLYP